MKNVVLILITLFLASCSGIQDSQTPLPTQIETISHVIVETQTPIQKIPMDTAVSSPILTSTIYDFPSWMSNPDTIMLAALFRDDIQQTRKIHFFNASTGEKFELNPSFDFGGFLWFDNMNFGLLSKDIKTSYKFNLKTGQVHIDFVSSQSSRFLNQDWANGLVVFNEPASNELTFDDSWQTNKSLNKLFTAQWNYDENRNEKGLIVTNTTTNQVAWENTLSENRYGTEFIWSPVNESQLAFLQGSPNGDFITEDMTLTVVDVSSGEIQSSYNGDFGIIEWSPDGKMILYLNPLFRYRNYGFSFKDAPCLLILATGEKRCLRSIPRVIPVNHNLATTGNYTWAEDSNSIFYTYEYTAPTHYEILGNLCSYSLLDSHITCPTQDLEVLHGNNVAFYDLSPDKKFIHLCYSDSSLMSDASGTSNDGIVKIDGSGFFSWAGTIIDGGPFEACSIETLWRPLP